MKPLERIPILANVLIVACERPATEVGKLVKAVVVYATKGVNPPMDDIRLETYFGLIAQDLDAQWAVAEVNAADDAAQSFERLKAVYDKTGTNGLQAFELWKKLSEEDRRAAFAHAQRMQGSSASRSYLFVYLRDRQWEYVERYEQTDTEI